MTLRLAVLCAAFNRFDVTSAGMAALIKALSMVPNLEWEIFLLDDASPDDTASRIKAQFPQIHVLHGTGQLFWNHGMCRAHQAAKDAGNWDAYLLFNDDTDLYPDAIIGFFETFQAQNDHAPAALIGGLVDPDTKVDTYGGYTRLSRLRPMNVQRCAVTGQTTAVDTFNGNFVLIPAADFDRIGGLFDGYRHNYGDLDAGYQLSKEGCDIYLYAQAVGMAPRNPPRDLSTWRLRWRFLVGVPNSLGQRLSFTWRNVPTALRVPAVLIAMVGFVRFVAGRGVNK